MATLTIDYKDSKDVGFPPDGSLISYYSLLELPGLPRFLNPTINRIKYDWYSACGEVHEHYDPVKDAEYKIGDSKPSTYFQDSEKESHRTVYLSFYLDEKENYAQGLPGMDFPRIAWEYTHIVQRSVSKYMGAEFFPARDINYLLNTGEVRPLEVTKVLVGEIGNQHYHVRGTFAYNDMVFYVKMAQDERWPEEAWTTEALKRGTFHRVDVFEWSRFDLPDEVIKKLLAL